ncbi:DeoR/GlpR family DNA-binding transcription regulator [Arthrobacter wenxiniae]|nr:DeoR/GlpR family DNA-binding transcription regulator [Arthrobacter wenxiniae]
MTTNMASATDRDGSTRHLPAGRKAVLAAYVQEAGEVTVAELAARLDVSTDTIRRDLDRLDRDGVLIRTHGGAVSLSSLPQADTGIDVRLRLQASAKETIGALAATLIQDDSVVMINAGTTNLAVARHMGECRGLTVATNSLRLPAELSSKAYRDLYVFGGTYHQVAQATIGPVSFQAAIGGKELGVQCDLALLAVGAVSVEGGYSTSNVAEAVMMSEMMANASRVAFLADSSKFGRRLFAQVAELGRADYFVTDCAPPDEIAALLVANEVEVMYPPAVAS